MLRFRLRLDESLFIENNSCRGRRRGYYTQYYITTSWVFLRYGNEVKAIHSGCGLTSLFRPDWVYPCVVRLLYLFFSLSLSLSSFLFVCLGRVAMDKGR